MCVCLVALAGWLEPEQVQTIGVPGRAVSGPLCQDSWSWREDGPGQSCGVPFRGHLDRMTEGGVGLGHARGIPTRPARAPGPCSHLHYQGRGGA